MIRKMKFLLLICALMISSDFLAGCSSLQSSTKPVANNGQKWRIAYYEGGPWIDYQSELISLLESLIELGWIEPFDLSELDKGTSFRIISK